MKRAISIACMGLLCVLVAVGLGAKNDESFSPYVAEDGSISLPDDFRTQMVHLGSWFVPEGDASGFHDVYSEAKSVDFFREHGRFPDGATLVKELRPNRAATYTTGAGVSHATADIKQWFVMIKDERSRFDGNPNWGEGWGWGLFKPDAPKQNVSTDHKTDCLACHIPARSNDWVYIEGYPTLSR